ncbi:NfeD family protein [Bryobacter aggregatus]|uniref:NfeD family protein n=1 Tax=Bryobacter aggregatus TaxID=360054 RepID=UPI0004E11357|nr:NfeD family protein [Bryobacter aggregatus]
MVTWWMWMVAGFAMLATEAVVPGFFLLFFGFGAVFMGFFQLLIPGVDLWMELLIFLSVSSLWLALFRKRLIAYMERRSPSKVVDSIAGETATALEDILPQQRGKAELRGTSWSALNLGESAIVKAQRCKVERMEGLTLYVRAM